MAETFVSWIWAALATYATGGVVFAILFVARWAVRLDPGADAGSLGFRLAIFPATVLLWPLLAIRLVRCRTDCPPPDPERPLPPRAQRLLHGAIIALVALAVALIGLVALSGLKNPTATTVQLP